ncbi:class I SAM-dependent DNA methyltransferase [Priestia megaterium]|uniref:class I SAM-dependent DNA methyltransferase n=1 Tax=Priestia megaterium TaxID=1404 RepID=UPI002ABD727D|nr:DNA methyltransferase [Priestia megaterium]
MATLSWNEIRDRAIRFSKEWKDETSENAEAKTFWNEFFNIFGITRRHVASFEERVKTLNGIGYIDLLWKGVLLIEHKSRGKDLERAYKQATDYFPGLKEAELPRYILVSDFERFTLHDLETDGKRSFKIEQLHENIELFGFIAGYQQQEYKEQDPVNIEAAEKMGKLHDKLKEIGYTGHELEVYLVRLLFCLFADNTGIFDRTNMFRDYIEQNTKEDGSDLGYYFDAVFDVLNKSEEKRLKTISESLNQFPYVNGKLFEERLSPAAFNKEMRDLFLDCCTLDWGKISPAIFGSMFQSVMKPEQRRELGAHYTSETNILKAIKSLFLDDLREEFESAKGRKKKLKQLHDKLAQLKLLDPACGCGNFLIIAYRELRLLEIDILKELTKGEFQRIAFLEHLIKVDVDQFYGIEIDEFPAQVAQVALWLTDHQMNMVANYEFGEYFVRLPLKKKANVVYGNALQIDWNDIVSKTEIDYILGNPPFIGSTYMNDTQKKEMREVTKNIPNSGSLDYVTCWFIKASEYIQATNIKVGFVSTNSITQGNQALILWKYLFYTKCITIHFAHQTFKWKNEARGNAGVHCVIIGFSNILDLPKTIYTYTSLSESAAKHKANNINQYLLDAPTSFIKKRAKPICDVPIMLKGSIPYDGGHFLFKKNEMEDFTDKEPLSKKHFRKWYGGDELIKGSIRYALYLKNCPPNELRKMPSVLEKVQSVRESRLQSKRSTTRKWADYPTQFSEDRVIDDNILAIPEVSSENRKIIPIGFLEKGVICSNKIFQIPGNDLYIFGVLNSAMHMAWTKTVCGRLENRLSYSNTIVYNNFIFPEPSEKDKKSIRKQSELILSIRKNYLDSGSTLADLYDPIAMPMDLLKAHQKLDKLVDKTYNKNFKSDDERVTHLFELYSHHTSTNEDVS